MATAEKLRKETKLNIPAIKKQFINTATDAIRRRGMFTFCIKSESGVWFSVSGNAASIPPDWLDMVTGWMKGKGFRVELFCNYWNPEYIVTK